MSLCPGCKSNERGQDPCSGAIVCAACGFVLDDDLIVADVGFVEDSSGRAVAMGHVVDASSALYSVSSTEISNFNARTTLCQLASALSVSSETIISIASRMYKAAFDVRMTRGRPLAHICAVCLYVALRKENQPVMLIEIADLLRVSVFRLGTIFMLLRRRFADIAGVIEVDPSIYVARFAATLAFGPKTRDVTADALKLIRRMKEDWISAGRRPAGICGAALLIAARMHGVKCTFKDIICVIKMSDETVKSRLREFASTKAAKLSPDEFRLNYTNEQMLPQGLPPSFTRNRIKEEKEKRMEMEKRKQLAVMQTEIQQIWPSESSIDTTQSVEALEPTGGKVASSGLTDIESKLASSSSPSPKMKEIDNYDSAVALYSTSTSTLEESEHVERFGLNSMSIYYGEETRSNEYEGAPFFSRENSLENNHGVQACDDETFITELDEDDEVREMLVESEEYLVREKIWNELNREYLLEQAERARALKRISAQHGDGPVEYDANGNVIQGVGKRGRGRGRRQNNENRGSQSNQGENSELPNETWWSRRPGCVGGADDFNFKNMVPESAAESVRRVVEGRATSKINVEYLQAMFQSE